MFEVNSYSAGWAEIVFPNYTSRISYFTKVPYDVINYIDKLINQRFNPSGPSPLVMDAEGWALRLFWDEDKGAAILITDEYKYNKEYKPSIYLKHYSNHNEFCREIICDMFFKLLAWIDFLKDDKDDSRWKVPMIRIYRNRLLSLAAELDWEFAKTLEEERQWKIAE